MMRRKFFVLALTLAALPGLRAGSAIRLRPPLRADADNKPIPKPRERMYSELYAIVYNSWCRHLDPEYKAQCASDPGALNVNAWDEVPDSSWFKTRMGTRVLTFEEIVASLGGEPPRSGNWTIIRVNDEGYTPKLDIKDPAGRRYVLKFDLKSAPERNSGAERICTLIMHAAGYNVPCNTIVYFRREDLQLVPESYHRDAANRRRRLSSDDLDVMFSKLAPMSDGRYRGLASLYISEGPGVGRFMYTGKRRDDPNDIIPHEMRRELRGMRVIASWINHVDVGDKNALDVWVPGSADRGFVRHYLLDFGSAMGSGDFVNGPFRVGHEYIFDGPSMGKSLLSLGAWRRPWDARGRIDYTEVGYFPGELFEPAKWKPNYPNLSFERTDAGDAYWGAKVVTAYPDALIEKLAEAGEYSRAEVTRFVADTFKSRRDGIGRHWLNGITPLEEFRIEVQDRRTRLHMRDIGVERGYASRDSRIYRYSVRDTRNRKVVPEAVTAPGVAELDLGLLAVDAPSWGAASDRWGRVPVARVVVEAGNGAGRWALPVEIVLGYRGRNPALEVLGWIHAPGYGRDVPSTGAHPETRAVD
jgi:hypothetical protein